MRLNVLALAIIVCAPLHAVANPAAVKPSKASASALQTWPSSSPTHREIFCGTDGAEPSLEYAKALNGALTVLTERGATTAGAMATLRERAKCPPGTHLPAPPVLISLASGGVK